MPKKTEWQQVAEMTLKKGRISVNILDEKLSCEEQIVYAWKTENEKWMRIGTSKKPFKKRLEQYSRHINQSLFDGKTKQTPLEEAKEWRKRLKKYGKFIAYIHIPPEIKSIAGKIRPYLDIERVLIEKYKNEYKNTEEKLLNRSHR